MTDKEVMIQFYCPLKQEENHEERSRQGRNTVKYLKSAHVISVGPVKEA